MGCTNTLFPCSKCHKSHFDMSECPFYIYAKDEKEDVAPRATEPLLCEALTLLEETGGLAKASKELQDWYAAHESFEEDRVRFEAAQKLSKRERRLLGINIAALKAKVK